MDGTGIQGPLRNMSMMEQIVALQAANLCGEEENGDGDQIMMSVTHLTNAIIKLFPNVSDDDGMRGRPTRRDRD